MITGNTLRGQAKIQLTQIDSQYSKYESLITNLLSENPQDRFSSKSEIIKHLESKNTLSPDDILFEFEDIIFKYMSYLGQSGQGFKKFDDIESINEIMHDLKNGELTLNYWLSQGYSDININKIEKLKLCDKCWLIGYNEVKIKSIWIFKHYYNLGCSCIIIETDKLEPSGVYEMIPKYINEEFGLFNGHYIKRAECDVGWAEINGKKVKLDGKAEIRVRTLKENIFFLAPQNGPLIRHIDIIDTIYKKYQKVSIVDERLLEPLNNITKDKGY